MRTIVTTSIAGALLAAAALSACGTTTTTEPAPAATASAPAYDGAPLAARVTAAMTGPTCGYPTTWRCNLSRFESPAPGQVNVLLTFPDGTKTTLASERAAMARVAVFATTWSTIPEIETVVSYINGVDSGSTSRGFYKDAWGLSG